MVKRKFISPTAIARASKCLHSWYLECFGDHTQKKEPDAGTLLMFKRGLEYERKCKESLPDIVETEWDGKDIRKGFEITANLMKKGPLWISGAVLLAESAIGFPDLLKFLTEVDRGPQPA